MRARHFLFILLVTAGCLFSYTFATAQAEVSNGYTSTLDLTPIPAPCDFLTSDDNHYVIRPDGSAMMKNKYNAGPCTELIYSLLPVFGIDVEYPQAVHLTGFFTSTLMGIPTNDTETVGNSSGVIIITSRWPKGTF